MRNLCLECPDDLRGKCCHYSYTAYTNKGMKCNVILINQKCPFFNIETKECIVYQNRFSENPYCEDVRNAVKNGALVEKCKYLKKFRKLIEVPPKRLDMPKDLRIIDKKMIEYLNSISSQRFLELFYPKLII